MAYRPTAGTPTPATRLSDADRDTAVDDLTQHVATGRLELDDFDARSRLVYAAVTRADLDSVFADLPETHTSIPRDKSAQGRAMSRELSTWAAVGVLCLSIWMITSLATGQLLYPWPIWVIGPWGAMLALQRMTGVRVGAGCGGHRI